MPHTSDGAPPRAAIVILGNDAVLAALPATPVQLAHACLRAGYASVIPASWGDELVAWGCLQTAATHPEATTILCACPHVRERLSRTDGELARFTITLLAPPVAAALYLRALAQPDGIEITYVGECPSARDPAIDVALSPAEFLERLSRRGIVLANEPTVYDSVLPPDRRRHLSMPGGVPAPDALREHGGARRRVDIARVDFAADLAEALLARERTLVHLAPAFACACAGAPDGRAAAEASLVLAGVEPPRAGHPIVDTSVPIDLHVVRERAVPGSSANGSTPHEADARGASPTPAGATTTPGRRRSPAFGALRLSSSVPVTRSGEGRAFPRAYAGKRRTPTSEPALPEAPGDHVSPAAGQTPAPTGAATGREDAPVAQRAAAPAPPAPAPAPAPDTDRPSDEPLAARTTLPRARANGAHPRAESATAAGSAGGSFDGLRQRVQQLVEAAARRVERHPRGFVARVTRAEGVSYRYRIFVPDAWKRGTPVPAILFLHGAGERGSDNSLQTVVGIGRAIRRLGARFPALVVLPQAPLDTVWTGAPARAAVQALDAALNEFDGDPDRVYLTGVSMGAYGAWQLALQYPDRFAAIVPICGGVRPPPENPAMMVRAIPPGTADPAAYVAERLRHLPTWIFHGALDPVIPVDDSRALADAMRTAGAPVRYTELPNVRHNAWDPAYANAELWSWLFAQRRAPAESAR